MTHARGQPAARFRTSANVGSESQNESAPQMLYTPSGWYNAPSPCKTGGSISDQVTGTGANRVEALLVCHDVACRCRRQGDLAGDHRSRAMAGVVALGSERRRCCARKQARSRYNLSVYVAWEAPLSAVIRHEGLQSRAL